ncbi:putative signal peptide-containing and transmembrane domain-containing protein [Cryptosporidium canis]|nr:putative signal peptide-containing and transmembrane domain-containing protein [Cryptosporidium canis]
MKEVVDLPMPALIVIAVILSFGSALFSGLTLGMMTQDLLHLKISSSSKANRSSAYYAKKLLPLRSNGNFLLVTLLFGNVTVNTGLSILISELTSGWLAFAVSTILIMIFGEIIPQAICSRYGLYIGGFFSPLIKLIQIVLFPILKPISTILDKAVGKSNEKVYSREELCTLLEHHSIREIISSYELELLKRVIFSRRSVSEIMTPIDEFQVLKANSHLRQTQVEEFIRAGVTRLYIMDDSSPNSDFLVDHTQSYISYSRRNDVIFLDIPPDIENKSVLNQYPGSPITSETYDSESSVYEDYPSSKGGIILGYIDLVQLSEQSQASQSNSNSPSRVSTIINTKSFKRLTNVVISKDMMDILRNKDTMSILSSVSCLIDKVLCIQSTILVSTLFDVLFQYKLSQKDIILVYSPTGQGHKIRYDGVITLEALYDYILCSGKYAVCETKQDAHSNPAKPSNIDISDYL